MKTKSKTNLVAGVLSLAVLGFMPSAHAATWDFSTVETKMGAIDDTFKISLTGAGTATASSFSEAFSFPGGAAGAWVSSVELIQMQGSKLFTDYAYTTPTFGMGSGLFTLGAFQSPALLKAGSVEIVVTGQSYSNPSFYSGSISVTGQSPTAGGTISAVPEAGEWAMMLLGLPMVGWMIRRKQAV